MLNAGNALNTADFCGTEIYARIRTSMFCDVLGNPSAQITVK
jgi:hypothetical protein